MEDGEDRGCRGEGGEEQGEKKGNKGGKRESMSYFVISYISRFILSCNITQATSYFAPLAD